MIIILHLHYRQKTNTRMLKQDGGLWSNGLIINTIIGRRQSDSTMFFSFYTIINGQLWIEKRGEPLLHLSFMQQLSWVLRFIDVKIKLEVICHHSFFNDSWLCAIKGQYRIYLLKWPTQMQKVISHIQMRPETDLKNLNPLILSYLCYIWKKK